MPGKFQYIIDHMEKMTPEETKQSLIRAGILTEDGQLAEKYRQGEDEEPLGQLPLEDLSKEQLIERVQDYQELVEGLESLVNDALAKKEGIPPLWVRRLLELHVYGQSLGDDDFICDGCRP